MNNKIVEAFDCEEGLIFLNDLSKKEIEEYKENYKIKKYIKKKYNSKILNIIDIYEKLDYDLEKIGFDIEFTDDLVGSKAKEIEKILDEFHEKLSKILNLEFYEELKE